VTCPAVLSTVTCVFVAGPFQNKDSLFWKGPATIYEPGRTVVSSSLQRAET
jgi:hypothetical protein